MAVGNKLSLGLSPLSYLGTSAGSPPNVTVQTRAPLVGDTRNVAIGDIWVYVNRSISPHATYIYMLSSLADERAVWSSLTPVVPVYVPVTSASHGMEAQGHYVTNVAFVTYTLPDHAPYGSQLSVLSLGGVSHIAQRPDQQIHVGSSSTTAGTTGYVESTALRDSITLVCVETDKTWAVSSMIGNWSIV
jgi:hypothetical protein